MATLQNINVGQAANDGTGDTLRDAMVKIEANLTAINSEVTANTNRPTGPGQQTRALDSVTRPTGTNNLSFTTEDGRTIVVSIEDVNTQVLLSDLQLTSISSPIETTDTLEGTHTGSFHIMGSALLSTLVLSANGIDIETVANPAADGRVALSFTIDSTEWSNILAADGDQIDFVLTATDMGSTVTTSNTVRIVREDVSDSNRVFYGLSASNNPSSVLTSSLSSYIIGRNANDVFNVDLGPTTAGHFIIFLVPADHTLSAIRNRQFNNVNVLPSYTMTSDVRTIDSQLFDAYVFGPVNAGFSVQYEVDIDV